MSHDDPLLRSGWAGGQVEICPTAARHEWRLNWPAVRDGWIGAGGRILADSLTGQEAC